MARSFILVAVLTLSACSGSSSTAPSPVSSAPAPLPPNVTVTPTPTPPAPPLPTRDPNLFSQAFWSQFVHNGYDAPPGTEPLRRLTTAPMLYVKTVDEAGKAIDAVTLQTIEDAIRATAAIWGGGQFGIAGVQRGTSSQVGVAGWKTVRWLSTNEGAFCGRSSIGNDGGFVDLNYLNPLCSCGGASKVYPRLARHELGHAFGYWHTDSQSDVMYGGATVAPFDCNLSPSQREIYHATLAYQTPVGSTTALRVNGRVIVD